MIRCVCGHQVLEANAKARCPACGRPLAAARVAVPSAPAGSDRQQRDAGTATVEASVIARAKRGDRQAIEIMLRSFIPSEEKIRFAEYLGNNSFFGFGEHSFGCLTERRIATIRAKRFGEFLYQDGFVEDINSSIVYHRAS